MNRIIITGSVLSIIGSSKANELLYDFKIDGQKESILLRFVFKEYENLEKIKENIENNTPLLIIGENDDDIEVKNTAGEYVLEVIKKAVVNTDAYSEAKIMNDGHDICFYCYTIDGFTTLCSCNRFCPLNSSCNLRVGAEDELEDYNTYEKAVL